MIGNREDRVHGRATIKIFALSLCSVKKVPQSNVQSWNCNFCKEDGN